MPGIPGYCGSGSAARTEQPGRGPRIVELAERHGEGGFGLLFGFPFAVLRHRPGYGLPLLGVSSGFNVDASVA